MTRTILIHLHVEAPDADARTPDEIADAVGTAIEFWQQPFPDDPLPMDDLKGLTFAVPLAEELEARA